jgi:hypothetical protein
MKKKFMFTLYHSVLPYVGLFSSGSFPPPRFGEPVYVTGDISEEEFARKTRLVEASMKALYEDTDLIWSDPARLRKIYGSEFQESSSCRSLSHFHGE